MNFKNIKSLPAREIIPGFHGRFIHLEKMTYSYWEIEAGSILPLHAHPHEQISKVLEGQLELTIASKTEIMKAGMLAVIPSNVPHTGKALSDCVVMDVFSPVREDYKLE